MIIDDELDVRKDAYLKILQHENSFDLEFIHSWKEMDKIDNVFVHAYLVDVILDNWRIDNLGPVFERIGKNQPIILVSRNLSAIKEDKNLMSKLSHVIDSQVRQFMAWSEFADDSNLIKLDNAGATCYRITAELDKFYKRSPFKPDPNEPLNIIHISDLQFGDPNEDKGTFFSEHVIANTLRARNISPHFLAITGDISFSGRPAEYSFALKWLESFLEELWPDKDYNDRILLVPGNHDVNLRFCAADYYEYSFEEKKLSSLPLDKAGNDQCEYGLSPFRDFAYKLTGDLNWLLADKNLCWISEKFLHLGLRFFHLNSTAFISFQNPDVPQIADSALQTILKLRPKVEDENLLCNIAISHHGPPDAGSEEKTFTNWGNIGNFFELKKMDVLIHGHGHAWRTRYLQQGSYTNKMIIVMAPSTHINKKKRPGNERRGFNLITLKRKDNLVRKIEVMPFEMDAAGAWDRPGVKKASMIPPKFNKE